MKRISILMIMLFCSIISLAQHSTVNYQGIARNEKGLPYANTTIGVRITIREAELNGDIVYTETRTVLTNAQGLFSFQINGTGATSKTGNLSVLNWGIEKSMETEIDPKGGTDFKSIGITMIAGVPVAQMAMRIATPMNITKVESQPLISLKNLGVGPGLMVEAGASSGIYAASSTSAPGIQVHGAKAGGAGILASSIPGAYALKVNGDINITSPTNLHGKGRVLTSDQYGNATWQEPASSASAFRASGLKGNAYQKFVPGDGFNKVMFYEVDRIDLGDEYDAPNSIFFPKTSGIYHLNAQVQWHEAINFCRMRIMLLRNGVVSELATDVSGTTGTDAKLETRTSRASLDISLYQNDAVWVEALYSGSYEGYAHIRPQGMDTWFSGHLIHKY
ncbi:MAG TPA: hypothetical protein VM488_00615 [Pseudobacter sp.]|nr:hypothetical protein [Pseudobacter sp.]